MNVNKQAIFAVFTEADNMSASFAERLLEQGVGDRATARPLAMEWAIEHCKRKAVKAGKRVPTVKLVSGQRGLTFSERDSAAERAANRVLQLCFPSADLPKPAPTGKTHKTDNVAKLLKAYNALTGAEKRRFLASV